MCSKTGNAGLMAEGKERFTEYKTDKADGQVNWAQEGKDAMKDWKPAVSEAICCWAAPFTSLSETITCLTQTQTVVSPSVADNMFLLAAVRRCCRRCCAPAATSSVS